MIFRRIISAVIFSLFLVIFFGSCSSREESKPLALKNYGPTDIRARQIFNKQASGESAIWTATENATSTTILVLSGVPLDSAPQAEGKVVTAVVPKSLYEKPGEYPLYLLDKKTNKKSNEIKFIVKP